IGGLGGTKERDVLLAERKIDRGQRVEDCQFPWIDLDQPNMGHGSRDRIRLSRSGALLFLALLALLVHHARLLLRCSRARGERVRRPVPPRSQVPLLLRLLQSGYPLLKQATPEGVRRMLHECLDPASEASRFPEERCGWLVHDHGEIMSNHLTGQGEGWPVPFIVEFQGASSMSITKGVIRAAQSNDHVSSFKSTLFCHDTSCLSVLEDWPVCDIITTGLRQYTSVHGWG